MVAILAPVAGGYLMTRLVRGLLVAGLLTWTGAGAALGFGGHGPRVTAQYPMYVAPVPVASVFYAVPVQPVYLVPPCPVPAIVVQPAASPFATPTPAPPS